MNIICEVADYNFKKLGLVLEMIKQIECYGYDVPLNCCLDHDIYTDSGALLLKEGTIVEERVKQQLNKFKQKIKVSIDVPDEVVAVGVTVEQDNIVELDSDVKARALQGVEYMYSNPDSSDVIDTAKETSTVLLKNIRETSGVNISLQALKVSDDYTFKHCVDVAIMGMLVARKYKLPLIDVESIATAGLLHDLGKTKVPGEILNKPGKLTDEEFSKIKLHPLYGFELLKSNKHLAESIKMGVLMHHEKIDGSGYPLGRAGEEISLYGRLLSIVDVYDALVTKRPYRDKEIEASTALEMLLGMSTQFDTKLLRTFLDCVIIYPIGSKVVLSNGRVCLVEKQNTCYPLRPVVRDVITNETFNLLHDLSCLSLTIVSHI